MEKDGEDYYRHLAQESTTSGLAKIFTMLADEEVKHLRIMENIVEFVTRPEPGNWLENAEWHHLDEF